MATATHVVCTHEGCPERDVPIEITIRLESGERPICGACGNRTVRR